MPNGTGVKLRRLIDGARRVRLEQASVSLNDLLAGAAPDTGHSITPVPLGRRRAAPTIRVHGTKAALARIWVSWNEFVRRDHGQFRGCNLSQGQRIG